MPNETLFYKRGSMKISRPLPFWAWQLRVQNFVWDLPILGTRPNPGLSTGRFHKLESSGPSVNIQKRYGKSTRLMYVDHFRTGNNHGSMDFRYLGLLETNLNVVFRPTHKLSHPFLDVRIFHIIPVVSRFSWRVIVPKNPEKTWEKRLRMSQIFPIMGSILETSIA